MTEARPSTATLILRLREEERKRLLSMSQEELADLVLDLWDQMDVMEQGLRKHELTAVYEHDRANHATARLKKLSTEKA